jgi:hypothetical protein
MRQLSEMLEMKQEALEEALKRSLREEKALMSQGKVRPSAYGNRKQRRAEAAIARKRETA